MPPETTNQPQPPTPNNDFVERMIPYKNTPALLAYYFGVFGLLPGLIPLSIAAIVLGFIGLSKQKKQPAIKGTVHARIGIILGTIELTILAAIIVIGVVLNSQ